MMISCILSAFESGQAVNYRYLVPQACKRMELKDPGLDWRGTEGTFRGRHRAVTRLHRMCEILSLPWRV